jgi:basic membrane protein A
MRRFLSSVVAITLVLAIAIVGLNPTFAADETATSERTARQGALRIGLVTDVGQVDDGSFNESAWNGVQMAAEELGAEAEYIETQDAADYATNIAEFADNGYNVIVTVGFALGAATIEAAAIYPDVHFVGVDQFQVEALPNLTGLIFPEDKSGFLAGVLAAGLTQTGTIAAVLGTDQVPPVVAFNEGYRSGAEWGAEQLGKELNIISTYHPGGLDVAFTDPAWGAATARQALDQNADVVFAAGGKTGNGGLIEVAGAVSAPGSAPFCIGVDTDQWLTVPEAHSCLVSSATKLIDVSLVTIINAVAEGAAPTGNFLGEVGLASFHDLEAAVPAELQALIKQAESGLRTGAVLTCYNLDLSELSIGLVTDVGQVDDGSFNESSWNGVLAVSRCGATVDFIETQDAADYATNIAEFADQGVDIIVTVGFALGAATAEAAASYPDVRFIGVDQFQGEAVPGVTGLIFPEDQAGYLAGVLAARLNQTGTIAAVLGTDQVPPVVAFAEGYRLGAQATNPDINVILTYHPGGLDVAFTDPAWGASTARQALDQGADVVFAAGGKTGNGGLIEVAGAVTTAGSAPFCIGVDTDQWFTVPEAHPCLISSAMKILDGGVATLILQYANGTIADGNFVGQVGLAPFHDLEGSVPAEVQAELEQLAIALAAGEITTGY